MKICFLGQNPSTKSPDTAFLGTRSGDILLRIISQAKINLKDVTFLNVLPFATKGNKTPSRSDFIKQGKDPRFRSIILGYDIVYVCGKMAKLAVEQISDIGRTKLVHIPHPSPRNRQWNDPDLFMEVVKMVGDAYEGKDVENMEGLEKRQDISYGRDRRDVLQRKTDPICPVVEEYRKKQYNHRGSSGTSRTFVGSGGE
jgi:hypothetical protein